MFCIKMITGIIADRSSIKDKDVMLTKRQQEFIGSQFPTPKGGVLTVVAVIENGGNKLVLEIECSICSQDIDLWPKGSIFSYRPNINKGIIPCGCSSRPRWSREQYMTLIHRECNKKGYNFLGIKGDWNGSKTYICLNNPTTGNTWCTTNISSLLTVCVGDPKDSIERVSKLLELNTQLHIADFYKAGFNKNYTFWRSDKLSKKGYTLYWNYTCPICSYDEYVINNVCSGIFETSISSLKEGRLSCRCSTRGHIYSQEQRQYQLTKLCKEEESSFVRWVSSDGYIRNTSKFIWTCKEAHVCSTTVANFLNNQRCKKCHKENQSKLGYLNGYYPHRSEEEDYLYCILFKKGNYIKVGRSFNIEERLKGNGGLVRKSKHSVGDISILQVRAGKHKDVYQIEQEIHRELTERGFYHHQSKWTIETFDTDCLHVLKELVNSSGLEEVDLSTTKFFYKGEMLC